MAKRKAAGLTRLERVGGVLILLAFYPLSSLTGRALAGLAGELLGRRVTDGMYMTGYYYVFLAVTAAVFHRLLATSTRRFLEAPVPALKTAGIGLVACFGLDSLAARLSGLLLDLPENRNDAGAFSMIGGTPHMMLLCVIFLGPFVEEVLFRGFVFGGLKGRSRTLAYAVSCALFALVHVWQFALSARDPAYLLLMVQYLAPGLALAWTYEHSGTLWASFGLHASVNALTVLSELAA